MTLATWRWLFRSIGGQAQVGARVEKEIVPIKSEVEAGLRLEQLMEIAHRHIDITALAAIYKVMDMKPFGFVHAALKESGLSIVTVNMDQLLDSAGILDVLYLHGNTKDLASIRTTITQYSIGLDEEVIAKLGERINNKRLLIMGYSGRDRDVLPLVATRFSPMNVTWVRLAGEPNYPEVELAKGQLLRRNIPFATIKATAQDFLFHDLALNTHKELYELSQGPRLATDPVTNELTSWLIDNVPDESRVLACASIAFEVALYTEARQLLDFSFRERSNYVTAKKIVARSLRRQEHRFLALWYLTQAAFRAGLRPVVNEMSASLFSTSMWWLSVLIDRMVVLVTSRGASSASRKMRRHASVRLRMRAINCGNIRGATAWIEEALEWPDELDRQSRVNELTWIADALKLAGKYESALQLLDAGYADSPYTDFSQRAIFLIKRIEVRAAAGLLEASKFHSIDDTDLHEAERFAIASSSAGEIDLWHRTVRAICFAAVQGQARRLLESARPLLPSAIGTEREFFTLCSAEQARFDGDSSLCQIELATLSRQLRFRTTGRARTWKLAMKLIELQLRVDQGNVNRSTVADLRELSRRYVNLRMPSAAAWVDLSIHQALGSAPSENQVREFAHNGWFAHSARASNPTEIVPWVVLV
ncbi:MAG TPA: hypothetical protein PK781_03455 [Terrimesophilobacter sp.]|nr:hypothetical protein [Terrimesophilobacter sp.]